MKFTREQLVDFVRGLAEPGLDQAIRSHAETDAELATQIQAMATVNMAAQFEREHEVPEMWALRAKALIPLLAASGRHWIAKLVFDSRQTPAFGMRSGSQSARDLQFESEWASVDLRLETGAKSTISGVATLNDADEMPTMRIEAREGDTVVAQAEATTAGEFDLEVESLDNLVLSVIDTETGNRVDVDLRSL